MVNKAVIRKYNEINGLEIYQKLQKIVALWKFNLGVNGKILKYAILKMAGRRVIQMKI